MPVLCLVVAVVGAGQVVFATAWGSVLASLVGRNRLLAAHGRLEGTRASADVAGPSIAGALVSLVAAPFALLLDAASYLVSTVTIARVVPALPALSTNGPRRSWRVAAAEGLRFLARHRVLRAVAASGHGPAATAGDPGRGVRGTPDGRRCRADGRRAPVGDRRRLTPTRPGVVPAYPQSRHRRTPEEVVR
ncbi:MFS transporter [Nocardioides guangzhouensis]|uniref:MFS transporter n=1 Tax=Nocardioides guangzhouensis TaxID=2497878 RepID=UPI0014383166|nr:MFS transporter [Nocardioides guangzhouensis]